MRPLAGGRVAAAPVARAAPFAGLYYGWVLVLALAVTETVSYGILTYAFPVFLAPMEGELGWSRTSITGAFSVALLISGVAAVPAGRWVDRHGPRALMTAGSVGATLLLLAWARVETLVGFYAIWIGLGVAMAAVLYEPAFAVVANWFVRGRGRALTLLTFVAGFASVVFVPLAAWLVQLHGWRTALLWLAAILAVVTVPPHALLLRRRPEDHGLAPDGAKPARPAPGRTAAVERSVPPREAVRSAPFRWLALAFGLSALATTAVVVHLIPLLLERGYSPTLAGAAVGAVGLMALPGRLVFTPLGGYWPRSRVTAAIFLVQAAAVAVLLAGDGPLALWTFVALFGAGFGAITPARAALVAELFGPAHFGAIGGMLAVVLAGGRAAAPVGASLLHHAGGGYAPVLLLLLGACLVSAGAALAMEPRGASPPFPSPESEP
jgi:MFS family permease